MAEIEYSHLLEGYTICLTKDEARLIEPIIEAREKREQAMADKYQDIIDGGDATDRQTTLQEKHDENARTLRALNKIIYSFLHI